MFVPREKVTAKKALIIAGIALVVVVVVLNTPGQRATPNKKIAVATQSDCAGVFCNENTAKSEDIAFEVSVPKKSFQRGEHVPAVFKATNVGTKTIRFSTSHLPISRFSARGDAQLLGQGMMHLTYANCRTSLCQEKWMGATVLHRPKACADQGSSSDACVTLTPGESVETQFDLAKYYSLARSGTYTFQVGGKLFDCVDMTSRTPLEIRAISNAVSFEHVNVEGRLPVKTAMEMASLDTVQAERDAMIPHIFVAGKDSVMLEGTHVTAYLFGLGATINFDVVTSPAGQLSVTLNGLIRLKFIGQTIEAVQDGTDSGTVRSHFPLFTPILAQNGSHHVSLEVKIGGYQLTIDGVCQSSQHGSTAFPCPTNILALEDDSPTLEYGQQVTVGISGMAGGTTMSNLGVTGGSILRRRLGTGCGTVSVSLSYTGCNSATATSSTVSASISAAASRIKSRNLHDTTIFGSGSDWSDVDSTFSNMANALCQSGNTPITSLRLDCRTDCAQYYAYVFASQTNQLTIYLCGYYFSAPASGRDSKLGVIVHELSHFNQIGGTEDFAYGCYNCKNLPASYSRNNADSFEYVIEGAC